MANKHYRQLTVDHFSQAGQKAVQPGDETPGNELNTLPPMPTTLGKRCTSSIANRYQVVREGFEPPTKGL